MGSRISKFYGQRPDHFKMIISNQRPTPPQGYIDNTRSSRHRDVFCSQWIVNLNYWGFAIIYLFSAHWARNMQKTARLEVCLQLPEM